MIYRHTDEQIQDYYERIGINQSSLKVILDDGIQIFMAQKDELQSKDELYYEEKKHFIIGSAVDYRISQGEDLFLKKYHFSKLAKKPGDSAMSVLKLAFDKAREEFPLGVDVDLTAYRKQVFEAANAEGYYMNRRNKEDNWELDTRIAELLKQNGQAYWTDLALAEGKQVLSDDEQMVVNAIILSLTTHKHTAHLFKDSADIDIVYQYPMYWSYKDVDCKGMIDMVIINHKFKRIILIDIKTTMELILRFHRAVNKRRYDLQASFYTYGLKQTLDSLSTIVNRSIHDYSIANFAFVAESTTRPGVPLIYVLSDDVLKRGEVGDEEYGGWTQAIDTYIAWLDVGFSIEKMYEETNGVLHLDTSTLKY